MGKNTEKTSNKEKHKSFLFSLFGKKNGVLESEEEESDPTASTDEPESPPAEPPAPEETRPEWETVPADAPLLRLKRIWQGQTPEENPESSHIGEFLQGNWEPCEELTEFFDQLEETADDLCRRAYKTDGEPAPVDAKAIFKISSDQLSAWCFLLPPLHGGKELSAASLGTEMKKNRITYGLVEQIAETLVEQQAYFQLTAVAHGLPPVDGKDGSIEDVIPRTVGSRHVEDKNGVVNFKDLNWLVHVNEGDTICKITPPVDPVPGKSVRGEPLYGQSGSMPPIPMGFNTILSPDRTTLLSKAAGQISFINGKYQVDELVTVRGNVDLSTGNLNAVGNLVIHGDVCDGFSVQTTGDVTVQGMVGSATILAGGNIFVKMGMNGNFAGRMEAGKDIKCIYVENGTIRAGGNVYMEAAINSDIACEGQVFITSGKGTIVGGKVSAMNLIEAKTVGNLANRLTTLTVGVTPEFIKQRNLASEAFRKAQMEMDKINMEVERLKKSEDPESAKSLSALRMKVTIAQLKISKTKKEYEEFMEQEQKYATSHLSIGVLYPVTQITIDGITTTVNSMRYECNIYKKDGEICIGTK